MPTTISFACESVVVPTTGLADVLASVLVLSVGEVLIRPAMATAPTTSASLADVDVWVTVMTVPVGRNPELATPHTVALASEPSFTATTLPYELDDPSPTPDTVMRELSLLA